MEKVGRMDSSGSTCGSPACLPTGVSRGQAGEGVRASLLVSPASVQPSSKRNGLSGEGHAHEQLGGGGAVAEKLELCHKEGTGRLKSALLAIGDVNEMGKMEEKSSGMVGESSGIPQC